MRKVQNQEYCFKHNCKYMLVDDYETTCSLKCCLKKFSFEEAKHLMEEGRIYIASGNGRKKQVR